MFKKTITYTDFNGTQRTEDFYFNLTQEEALTQELSAEGNSFQEHMKRIAASNNGKVIIQSFKDVIKVAYGVKSADGRKFEKSDEIFNDFASTNAYSSLFMELATDAGVAAEFVNGIAPADMEKYAEKLSASAQARQASEAKMQGFNKPKEPEVETVQLAAAEPVLDAEPTPTFAPADTSPTPPTFEEYQEFLKSQGFKQ